MSAIVDLLSESPWEKERPATEHELLQMQAAFGTMPDDYMDLLSFSNGGCFRGVSTPFIVYSASEVLALFREGDLYRFIPESLVFGGDGGGTIYCLDLRRGRGREVFFIREEDAGYEPNARDFVVFHGGTLTDVIRRVLSGEKLN